MTLKEQLATPVQRYGTSYCISIDGFGDASVKTLGLPPASDRLWRIPGATGGIIPSNVVHRSVKSYTKGLERSEYCAIWDEQIGVPFPDDSGREVVMFMNLVAMNHALIPSAIFSRPRDLTGRVPPEYVRFDDSNSPDALREYADVPLGAIWYSEEFPKKCFAVDSGTQKVFLVNGDRAERTGNTVSIQRVLSAWKVFNGDEYVDVPSFDVDIETFVVSFHRPLRVREVSDVYVTAMR